PVASKRRKVGIEFPEQTIRLPLDDINADLTNILGSRQQTAAETTARLPQKTIDNFKSERRRLFCGKYILEDGDEVVISSPIIKEDYIGTISSITDDAVFVKLSSGQKVRIYLDLIEHKRCEVKPFLRGSAGMGSLQTTGWAECEPF
uniref:Uncharacterized protein n=1 Tax=Globisporangium ultimum (strain ATCC 200006 / CBS 805.95 / DAOM BR144) TaxID=431595 RepID=K3X300_GLOUD